MTRPTDATTFVELLQARMAEAPEHVTYTFLSDSANLNSANLNSDTAQGQELTRRELDRQARMIGATLQQAGATGERVLLLYPPGLSFIAAFFGCLYAGAIAVPAYPPRFNRPMPRLRSVVADAQASFALTTAHIHSRLEKRLPEIPDLAALQWIVTDTLESGAEAAWTQPQINGDSLAFLQYTSGSTAAPKGVMVSHHNLLSNLSLASKRFGMTSDETGVFWLPLYHDLGLIGSMLGFLYNGASNTLMSPLSFLQNPFRWLQVISQQQATVCGGPNFAYDLCVNRISPAERETLDLSSLALAFSGAEPIRPETLDRFVERFGPCGFRRNALFACYGLAEATLCVTAAERTGEPIIKAVDAAAIRRNEVILTTPDQADSRLFVSCGQNLPGQKTLIVDPLTLSQCADSQVGEIWVAGPSIASGYWNRPEQNQELFGAHVANTGEGPFLRTGDLGFFLDEELFVTGRMKDLIIVRGRNHYPQDIELTVEQSYLGLEPGGGAAFSVEMEQEERLIVIQEVNRQHRKLDIEEAAQAVRQAVADAHALQIHAVVFIQQGTLPRTSSGKVQRFASRAKFLSDELTTLGTSHLNETARQSEASPPMENKLKLALSQLDEEARKSELTGQLQSQIAQAIGLDAEQIIPDQPLAIFGFDSLLLFELKSRLEAELDVLFPAYAFQSEGSVNWLVEQTLAQWMVETLSTEGGQSMIHMEQDTLTGAVPLTPIQHYFFEKVTVNPSYWNATGILEVNRRLDATLLTQVFQQLLIQHDALRLRFAQQADGTWLQLYSEPPNTREKVPFQRFDLSDLSAKEQETEIEAKIEQLQATINLTHGPLMQTALIDLGPEKPNQLVMLVHHVIADGLSIHTLLQQLQSLYQQLEERPEQLVALPLKSTSYRYWAERLHSYAQSDIAQSRLESWVGRLPASMDALPRDMPMGDNLEGSAQSVQRFLDEDVLQAFLDKARSGGANGAETLLATAIAQACQMWCGQSSYLIEFDRHGREPLFEDVDLSRTTGFFNNRFPVLIDLKEDDVEASWMAANQSIAQLPNRGLDYGILRYLSQDKETRQRLQCLPQPEIKLIYHSQLVNQMIMLLYGGLGAEGMQVIDFATKAAPNELRPHTFETYCYFMGPQLYFEWRYSKNTYRAETMEALMENFVGALYRLIGLSK